MHDLAKDRHITGGGDGESQRHRCTGMLIHIGGQGLFSRGLGKIGSMG
jgi:hypothetical protein